MFLDERIDRVSRNSIECADLEITDLGMRLPIVRQNHVERGVELGFRVVELGHQESRRTGGAIARILRSGRSRATLPTTVRTIHTLHPTNGCMLAVRFGASRSRCKQSAPYPLWVVSPLRA